MVVRDSVPPEVTRQKPDLSVALFEKGTAIARAARLELKFCHGNAVRVGLLEGSLTRKTSYALLSASAWGTIAVSGDYFSRL